MTGPRLTPEQVKAWEGRKLDHRCLDCGATSAAGSSCYACTSTRIEYRTHAEQHDLEGSYWCGGRKPSTERREAMGQRPRIGTLSKQDGPEGHGAVLGDAGRHAALDALFAVAP